MLLAIWVLYLLNDFAFRHGHITPDGRYFSHVHYSQDKDGKHTHSEEELIFLDIISNPTYLDVQLPNITVTESKTSLSSELILLYQNFAFDVCIDLNLLRGPPCIA